MSILKQITFYTKSGGQQTLTVQDYEATTDIEYWRDPDFALSGFLRQNMRGSRRKYSVSYKECTDPATYRTLFNNIVSDLHGGSSTITVSEGADLTNARSVVPTDRFSYAINYRNQLSSFVPDIELVDVGINRLDGTYIATGYVATGYVE